jgi:hypothetical protein
MGSVGNEPVWAFADSSNSPVEMVSFGRTDLGIRSL